MVLIDQGFGPIEAEEVDDADFAAYNGRDGGKVWRWYEPGVFQSELQKMGVSVETCTERQCIIALRRTSEIVKDWGSAYLQGLVCYAGPQCYPQLKDPARLGANA